MANVYRLISDEEQLPVLLNSLLEKCASKYGGKVNVLVQDNTISLVSKKLKTIYEVELPDNVEVNESIEALCRSYLAPATRQKIPYDFQVASFVPSEYIEFYCLDTGVYVLAGKHGYMRIRFSSSKEYIYNNIFSVVPYQHEQVPSFVKNVIIPACKQAAYKQAARAMYVEST